MREDCVLKYNIHLNDSMRKILLLFMAAMAALSCSTGGNPLVKMAKKQMPVTIKNQWTEEFNNIKNFKIDSVELVYEDDSICMMQCIAKAYTLNNQAIRRELRYVYLFDTNLSNLNRKMIFNDGFWMLPCLPKDRIKSLLKENYLNHQSVYQAMYVRTHPIKNPVVTFKR